MCRSLEVQGRGGGRCPETMPVTPSFFDLWALIGHQGRQLVPILPPFLRNRYVSNVFSTSSYSFAKFSNMLWSDHGPIWPISGREYAQYHRTTKFLRRVWLEPV